MRDAYQLRSLNCRHKTTENLTMKTTAFALLAMAATAVDHVTFRPGAVVSGFLPIRSEADIGPLMQMLREAFA